MCLAWNAAHDRGRIAAGTGTAAEIDKYVTSWWLLREQDPARYPAELHRLLFERARVDVRLAGGRCELYRKPISMRALCRRLERQLSAQLATGGGETLAELRRFYA